MRILYIYMYTYAVTRDNEEMMQNKWMKKKLCKAIENIQHKHFDLWFKLCKYLDNKTHEKETATTMCAYI